MEIILSCMQIDELDSFVILINLPKYNQSFNLI